MISFIKYVHLRELLSCFGREPVGRPSLQLRRQSSGHFESKLRTLVGVIRSDVQRQAERFADVQKETRDLQHVTFSLLDLLSVKLHVFQDLFLRIYLMKGSFLYLGDFGWSYSDMAGE